MNIKARIEQWWAGLTVKRRMTRKLRGLDYDFDTFSIESFSETVSALKNRDIFFIEGFLPSGWAGCWVSIADPLQAFVFYARDLSPLLQVHTQLHELSHILCEHPTLQLTYAEMRDLLQRGQLAAMLQGALPRSPQTDDTEQEAETLAVLIQLQAIRHARPAELTAMPQNPETAALLRDLGVV